MRVGVAARSRPRRWQRPATQSRRRPGWRVHRRRTPSAALSQRAGARTVSAVLPRRVRWRDSRTGVRQRGSRRQMPRSAATLIRTSGAVWMPSTGEHGTLGRINTAGADRYSRPLAIGRAHGLLARVAPDRTNHRYRHIGLRISRTPRWSGTQHSRTQTRKRDHPIQGIRPTPRRLINATPNRATVSSMCWSRTVKHLLKLHIDKGHRVIAPHRLPLLSCVVACRPEHGSPGEGASACADRPPL
jgi:hypothetical protein